MADREDNQLAQLTAYLDGELPAAERAKVEALLATDASARRLLAELRRTAGLVAGLPRAQAPTRLAEEISARIERQALLGDTAFDAGRPATYSALRRVFAVAAALAIVVTTGWIMFPQVVVNAPRPEQIASRMPEHRIVAPEAAPADRRQLVLFDAERAEAPAAPATDQRQDDARLGGRAGELPPAEPRLAQSDGFPVVTSGIPPGLQSDPAGLPDSQASVASRREAGSSQMSLAVGKDDRHRADPINRRLGLQVTASAPASPMSLRTTTIATTSQPAATSQPVTATTHPAATQPATSQPASSQPATTQPALSPPPATQPQDKSDN